MTKTLIAAIVLFFSALAVHIYETPLQPKGIVVLALLLIATGLGVVFILKKSAEGIVFAKNLSDTLFRIHNLVKQSETELTQYIDGHAGRINTRLDDVTKTFSSQISDESQRTRTLVEGLVVQLSSGLAHVKELTLAADEELKTTQRLIHKNTDELRAQLRENEKQIAATLEAQQKSASVLEDTFSQIHNRVKQSETELTQYIDGHAGRINTRLDDVTKTFSSWISDESQRTRVLAESLVAQLASDLAHVRELTLAGDEQLQATQRLIDKNTDELRAQLQQNEKQIAAAFEAQHESANVLEKRIRAVNSHTQGEIDNAVHKIESAIQDSGEELADIRNDLRMQIVQASTAITDKLISLGGATNAQAQALVAMLAHPTKDRNFDENQWEFNDGKISKRYTPGRLIRVDNAETDTSITFNYSEDGKTVTSDVAIGNALRYRTVSSHMGTPIKGWEFDPAGRVKVEYSYDDNGQLEKRNQI